MIIEEATIDSLEASRLIGELSDTLCRLTGSSGKSSFNMSDMQSPRAIFVIARVENVAVGCGALREISEEVAEIKRMYVARSGRGIGRGILEYLESKARTLGYSKIILDTRKCNENAVKFYIKNDYCVGNNYGKYRDRPEAICFYKEL